MSSKQSLLTEGISKLKKSSTCKTNRRVLCKRKDNHITSKKAKIKVSGENKISDINEILNGSNKKTNLKYVGAHVSISGGIYNAVKEAYELGAKSFALFLRSQRQWKSKTLDTAAIKKFKDLCREYNFSPDCILPHAPYLLNLGSPNDEILQKSCDLLLDDLQKCEELDLVLYNVHPGSTCGLISVEDCIARIANSINMCIKKTNSVKVVLENMSAQGHTIGGKFAELKSIIDLIDNKSRIGVCLDTCHAFAAGYDISNEEGFKKMLDEFSKVIGWKYLVAVHLNDSKGDLGCHLDRHENIGKGKIGIEGFRFLMNNSHFNEIPLILETPFHDNIYQKEIELLYKLQEKI